jgi:hypothetical protein
MQKKHIPLIVLLSLLCACFVIYGIFGFGRSGGKVWFDAVILEINGNMVTAEVISSGKTALSPKLPAKITFTADSADLGNVKVGDIIEGEWQYGSIRGHNVRVFWFVKNK